MSSLVNDYLVNPVLRQARRFSHSRSSLTPSSPHSDYPLRMANTSPNLLQEVVVSEAEEDSYLPDDAGDSASSQPSSRSSVVLHSHMHHVPSDSLSSVGSHELEPQTDLLSNSHLTSNTSELLPAPIIIQSILQDSSQLPEDDGMSSLRKRIYAIQTQDIDHSEKARMMHQLLIEGYTNSQAHAESARPFTPSSPRSSESRAPQSHGPLEAFKFWQNALDETENAEAQFALTDEDLQPTFVPTKQPAGNIVDNEQLLGCEHYRRNVKLQCSTCNRWYTCRFCHDKVEDHNLIRKETKNMLCMFCGTAQKANQACVSCEAPAARYYCDICKLWNDDPDKPCYHCNDCGICRVGRGIGKDFYHCKKCIACIAIASRSDHRCIERVTDCDCPICGDYMFTSPLPVCFMRCGHSIHRLCFEDLKKTSYKCPICSKSIVNMESQFRNLDLSIQAQPMPLEFEDTRAMVLCNDCSAKSSTMYHWLGLKCGVCQSYNTAQLQIIGPAADAVETDLAARSALLLPSVDIDSVVIDATGRDMRRRHSSIVDSSCPGGDLDFLPPDRLGRSASPIAIPGRSFHTSSAGSYFDLEDDEEDTDIMGFWRRVPRSITSNNESNDDDDAAESSDDMTSDEELEDNEGDESEDDDFELLGHR